MSGKRACEQCGAGFVPRREHARFCSAACRMAWNRTNTGHRTAQISALDWSLTAMCEATGRLEQMRTADELRGLTAISEAVWWVTLVDATLVRYHPGDYDVVLARHSPDERRAIENTLGGLRFVRNQTSQDFDLADFANPPVDQPGEPGQLSVWGWQAVPRPAHGPPEQRDQQWEVARYQSFQAQLAGHCVGETFSQAAAFLRLVAGAAGLTSAAMV